MKKIIFILTFVFVTGSSFGQISGGGQFSYLQTFDLGGTPGVGIKIEVSKSNKLVFTGGLNYYLPVKKVRAAKLNSENYDMSTSINVEEKIIFVNFQTLAKYYFIGNNKSNFGAYGLVGIGLWLIPLSQEVLDEYDQSIYTSNIPKDYSENLFGISSNFGLGFEKELAFGYIYFESGVNIKVKSIGGGFFHQPLPNSGILNLGIRYPLN
jgi:hypothetical protein